MRGCCNEVCGQALSTCAGGNLYSYVRVMCGMHSIGTRRDIIEDGSTLRIRCGCLTSRAQADIRIGQWFPMLVGHG